MRKLKEVTVFTNGDSGKLSTWSNVPYFFTETLIVKGIKVNRVNISPPFLLRGLYKVFISPILKLFNKNSTYTFYRTDFNFRIQQHRIRRAIQKFPDSDAYFSLLFSFSSAGLTKKPTVLFGDWTYDHYFNYFAGRLPYKLEKRSIEREDRQIEAADLVFPLFPSVAKYMKGHYQNKNIYYLGNVVNTLYESNQNEILELKRKSFDLIFVGSKKYKEGARTLIGAFEKLKTEFPELKLHMIGMKTDDFEKLPPGVHCYGYLNKDIPEQRELYYSLLKSAKAFVNTNPKWGAFSANLEAMYFYVPVIVTPYPEFRETIGRDIHCGYYCEGNSVEAVAEKIRLLLHHPDYEKFCVNAHELVKDFTWSAYIDQIIQKTEEIL